MKRLTLYFLKRWWWVYLIVFVFDFLMFGSGDNDQGQMSYMRVLLSLVCLFVFSKFLLNGGKGAFWLPLTRSQIGRVYWFFMLILPALIYASAEIVGQLLNSGGAVFSIWLPLKHFIFFAGFASLT